MMPEFLDNKYQLIALLGTGGFGQVWLARDLLISERQVAIKVLKKRDVRDASMLVEEMRHLNALDHPNIVTFLHPIQDEETLYLVMEYCQGGSLDQVTRGTPFDAAQVFAWGETLARTLEVVHGRGIVHHDIKPQNVLITADGRIKIADFGIANRKWGTRAYMAPEMFLAEDIASSDARIDVYALGITLLELLLGFNPLRNTPAQELTRTKIRHAFIPDHLERWVQEILLKATHPTPEQRFQTMDEFREAIESRRVPYAFDKDRIRAQRLAAQATKLLERKKWRSAARTCAAALKLAPDCVAALIVAGRTELLLKRPALARTYFAKALMVNPRAPVQRELGWLALEDGQYAQAISMLSDHLQRSADDFEAYNLLLHCFYLTRRYEVGERCVAAILDESYGNDCFRNNAFLFRFLNDRFEPDDLDEIDKGLSSNPFFSLNLEVITEFQKSWAHDGEPSLQSKLLFQDYRFGSIETRRKAPVVFIDCGDGQVFRFKKPLITIGRYACNDIQLDRNGISRRHAVVVNYPNDAWVYDLGSQTGVRVDDEPVAGRAFLSGVHTLHIGARQLRIATKEGLLI